MTDGREGVLYYMFVFIVLIQQIVINIASPPAHFFLPQNEGFMGLEQGHLAILSADVNKNIGTTVAIGVGLCHLSSQQ